MDPLLKSLLLLSIISNVALFTFYVWRSNRQPLDMARCLRYLQTTPDTTYLDANKLNDPMYRPEAASLTLRRSRLTHIVMPFHHRQEPIVMKNLELWSTFPPCVPPALRTSATNATMDPFFAKDEHPAGLLGQNIGFTFFVSADPDEELEGRLLRAFDELPSGIRQCFSGATVRFARLKDDDDSYLTGSRKQFEQMLNGWLGLQNPSYVLYMEPDCLPVRPNWVTTLDAMTRWPTSQFWIKGSMFRGNVSVLKTRILYNLFHINGNAIYNLGDPAFRHFYFDLVRPFIIKYFHEGAYDTDIFKFLLDLGNYNYARHVAHMFQFTDAIQNLYHTDYSLSEIKATSDMVVLVHGGKASP